jgi:hypothetical protein
VTSINTHCSFSKLTTGNMSLFARAHKADGELVIDLRLTVLPSSGETRPATPFRIRLQPAPANLIRTEVRAGRNHPSWAGWPNVYVPIRSADDANAGMASRIFDNGVVSLFVNARSGDEGLSIDLALLASLPVVQTALPVAA